MSGLLSPPLTSTIWDVEQVAQRATSFLLEAMAADGPQDTLREVVAPVLVTRPFDRRGSPRWTWGSAGGERSSDRREPRHRAGRLPPPGSSPRGPRSSRSARTQWADDLAALAGVEFAPAAHLASPGWARPRSWRRPGPAARSTSFVNNAGAVTPRLAGFAAVTDAEPGGDLGRRP